MTINKPQAVGPIGRERVRTGPQAVGPIGRERVRTGPQAVGPIGRERVRTGIPGYYGPNGTHIPICSRREEYYMATSGRGSVLPGMTGLDDKEIIAAFAYLTGERRKRNWDQFISSTKANINIRLDLVKGILKEVLLRLLNTLKIAQETSVQIYDRPYPVNYPINNHPNSMAEQMIANLRWTNNMIRNIENDDYWFEPEVISKEISEYVGNFGADIAESFTPSPTGFVTRKLSAISKFLINTSLNVMSLVMNSDDEKELTTTERDMIMDTLKYIFKNK